MSPMLPLVACGHSHPSSAARNLQCFSPASRSGYAAEPRGSASLPRGSNNGHLRHSVPPGEVRGVCGVRACRVGVQAAPPGGCGPAGAGLQSRSGSAVSHLHCRDQSCHRMRVDLRARRELEPSTGLCLSGAGEPLGPAPHQGNVYRSRALTSPILLNDEVTRAPALRIDTTRENTFDSTADLFPRVTYSENKYVFLKTGPEFAAFTYLCHN
ncbi:hypothetical protein NDU88_001632 [Pleurodeles waltl]|uniref:Uncharacterized protein n=1 Tax=Pleurodeles waltl TaxID=8319 RepID=A0AAV7TI93_PLEWA|nr:hypothetical protein NDU88_001632 [Pleurodeles waltl]